MNYIKTYESFNDTDLQIIKDILLEIEDDGFKIEYHYDSNFKITHILIKYNEPFYINDNIRETFKRISTFLGKTIYGFWRGDMNGEQKFYVYSDERDIRTGGRTGGNKMKVNWPRIYSMRLLIHH